MKNKIRNLKERGRGQISFGPEYDSLDILSMLRDFNKHWHKGKNPIQEKIRAKKGKTKIKNKSIFKTNPGTYNQKSKSKDSTICIKCNKKQPERSNKYFPRNPECKDGLLTTCKDCFNSYQRKRERKKSRDKQIKQLKYYYNFEDRNVRKLIFTYLRMGTYLKKLYPHIRRLFPTGTLSLQAKGESLFLLIEKNKRQYDLEFLLKKTAHIKYKFKDKLQIIIEE